MRSGMAAKAAADLLVAAEEILPAGAGAAQFVAAKRESVPEPCQIHDEEDRIRVLLIEDDVVDRFAFDRFVRKEGLRYDHVMASSYQEARAVLDKQGFDVILTDYHLGDGTALEILQLELDVPVVVITGAGDEEIAVQAMRAGAFDYLTKDTERRYLKMVQVTIENAQRHYLAGNKARMLQQALRSINDAIFIAAPDGRLFFVNESFSRTYGWSEREASGLRVAELWAEGEENELAPLSPVSELPATGERGECWHRRRDGSHFAAFLSRAPIFDERGRQVATVGAVRDVSERKRWEQALEESEERYALAAAGANDGLWDWDLRSGHLHISSRWKSTLGYGDAELQPDVSAWLDLVHPEDAALLRAQLDAHIAGQTPHFETEHRIRSKGGDWRWVQVRGLVVRDPSGRAYRFAGSQRDVTDRRRAEEQLAHSGLHDALTGLPNRVLFMDRLESALRRFQRRGERSFAVIFLDLDRFKVINDSLGHLAGDRLLRALAERLRHHLRLGDTFARLGGDEFGILLEEVEVLEEVEEVAGRIQHALAAPFDLEGHEVFSGASMGIAMSSPSYEKAEDLLRDADTAMYQAKALGRTRKVIFRPDMHQSALARLHIESDLRRAIERKEFRVYYQPLVDLKKGLLRGFEALVRWQHPERGLIYPGDFLSIAQEAGLTTAMGALVLEEACCTLKAWQDEAPAAARYLSVSVNLDGQQLSSPDLMDQVLGALAKSALEPKYLRLEITEDLLVRQPERAKEILTGLREQGVKIYLDDFGIGYSSLSQLQHFPIDVLKVDRSFVQRMIQDESAYEIVKTILQLAGNLGLETLAEGIEKRAHLEAIAQLGCRFGQGYLFAAPLPAEEARLWAIHAADRIVPGFAED